MVSVALGSIEPVRAAAPVWVETQREALQQHGYQSWRWLESDCQDCEIYFLTAAPEMHTAKVQAFIEALVDKKAELQKLYNISGPEYTLLAQMSIGILGRESKFWMSPRYILKENFPGAIYLIKVLRTYLNGESQTLPMSRGPTQIKYIPAKIVRQYAITPDTLYVPENAALATMGFLIEALAQLKRRIIVNRLSYIGPANYIDYLPYLYFGSTRKLVSGEATPSTNLYIKEMKQHMAKVEIYERPPSQPIRRPL